MITASVLRIDCRGCEFHKEESFGYSEDSKINFLVLELESASNLPNPN